MIQQSSPDAGKNILLSKYWLFEVGWGWPVSVPNLISSHKKESPLEHERCGGFYPCKQGGEQVLLII